MNRSLKLVIRFDHYTKWQAQANPSYEGRLYLGYNHRLILQEKYIKPTYIPAFLILAPRKLRSAPRLDKKLEILYQCNIT